MVGTSLLLLFPYFKEELGFTRHMGCSDKEWGRKTIPALEPNVWKHVLSRRTSAVTAEVIIRLKHASFKHAGFCYLSWTEELNYYNFYFCCNLWCNMLC